MKAKLAGVLLLTGLAAAALGQMPDDENSQEDIEALAAAEVEYQDLLRLYNGEPSDPNAVRVGSPIESNRGDNPEA